MLTQAGNIFACTSASKRRRTVASSAPNRSLSLSIHSTFAAAAFAVVIFAGAFAAMPARAQSSPLSFSTVHTFDYSTNSEGGNPVGHMVEDSDGNLFGMAQTGGTGTACQDFGCGTIYELIPNGDGSYSETTLWNFDDIDGEENPIGGLVLDSSRDLFGTTLGDGSPTNIGTIFELPYDSGTKSYDQSLITLYTFTGCSNPTTNCDGGFPSGSLVLNKGNLYGTTQVGGAHAIVGFAGTIFELKAASTSTGFETTVTTLYNFSDGNDGGQPVGGLILYDGNLFGTTSQGGGGSNPGGTVFELKANSSSSTGYAASVVPLYTFQSGYGYGYGSTAALFADGSGNLFGTTSQGGELGGGTIFELKADLSNQTTGYESSVIVLRYFTFDRTNQPPTLPGYNPEGGVVLDGSGNIYGTTFLGGNYNSTNYPNCTLVGSGCGIVFELPTDSSNPTTGYATSITPIHLFTGGDDGANPGIGALLLDSSGNIFGNASGGGNDGCPGGTDNLIPSDQGCGAVFELATTTPLNFDSAKLRIFEGDTPGFELQADITPGGTFDPSTQTVKLTVGSYTVTIPAGSFGTLPHGRYQGAWVYSGVINNVSVSVQIDPLGSDGNYEFKANAFPVGLPPDLTSINVSITVGTNAGSTTVTPLY